MKKIFLLIGLFLTNLIFSQDKINQLDNEGKRHGLWKGIHEESKRPRYEGVFEHGKEKGTFKFFDDTKAGSLIATRDFSKGEGYCYTIFYSQKGNKVSEGLVVNKQYEGEWKYYHNESNEIMALEFYKNGKLEGKRKVFYIKNILAEETDYKEGLKNGIHKMFSKEGKLLEELNYLNDKLHGSQIYYDAKGNKSIEGQCKNGAKIGKWKIYKDGKVWKTVDALKLGKELEKMQPVVTKVLKTEPTKEFIRKDKE